MDLSRLSESGMITRISHGVYKIAGAPGDEFLDLRAAWLAADASKTAWERLREKPEGVIVSGESAAFLHGIGNFRAAQSEFTTPIRRQTQRTEVRYRVRPLRNSDVTVRNGLPVTTLERTIADLVEQRAQLAQVGGALRDAARRTRLDTLHLVELLSPLAERNGHPKGNGSALLKELVGLAQLDLADLGEEALNQGESR